MRILLVRLSAIGDCLHAVPLAVALRQQLPEAEIGWAIEAPGYQLLAGLPAVDRFHLYPRPRVRGPRSWPSAWIALRRFRRELRSRHYDVAVDAQGLTKSGLVAWWSGAPTRIGFGGEDSRELNRWFHNRSYQAPPARRHVVERNLGLLEVLGLEVQEPRWQMPSYEADAGELESFLRKLRLGSSTEERPPFVILNPGTTWPTKTWPVEAFAAVARRLVEELKTPVVVTWGSARERLLAAQIAAFPGCHLAPPTDLRELAALIRHAALFVGNDTGPLHLAAALGVPCVGIFGATDPERNGPFGERHRVVVANAELPCRPCRARSCQRHDLACLQLISPHEVFDACAELLGT